MCMLWRIYLSLDYHWQRYWVLLLSTIYWCKQIWDCNIRYNQYSQMTLFLISYEVILQL